MGAIKRSAQTLQPGYAAPKDHTDPREHAAGTFTSNQLSQEGFFSFFPALMLLYTTKLSLFFS